MKRIFGMIVIAALTSIATFMAAKNFIYKGQIFSKNADGNNYGYDLHNASYVAEPSADGGYVNLENAAEVSSKAVVHIKVESKVSATQYRDPFADLFGGFFGSPRSFNVPQSGSGSGVIISQDGYIVTNNHVIDNADAITVTFYNKKTLTAKVIGADPSTDLAVLKVEEKGLPTLNFGNSDNLKLGEWVLAVGYPLNLEATVTAGIISAKYRNIGIYQSKGNNNAIESFIQTDAAVNPGNSGGALVNAKGELIGINSAIASPTGSYAGYSYAIPSNLVKKVVDDMMKFGNVQRAYLGVSFIDPKIEDENLRKEYNLDNINGLYVDKVMRESGAEEAGLKEGDIITKIENANINSAAQLQEKIANYHPGDKVNITISRNGTSMVKSVVLKNSMGNTEIVRNNAGSVQKTLGANLRNLNANEKAQYRHGVLVEKIVQGPLTKYTSMRNGFLITEINDEPINNVADVERVLNSGNKNFVIVGFYPGSKGNYFYGFRID